MLLSGLIVTLPLAPWVTAATVSAPPPGLLSLQRTSMTSALSSVPVAVSFCASGDEPPEPPVRSTVASRQRRKGQQYSRTAERRVGIEGVRKGRSWGEQCI